MAPKSKAANPPAAAAHEAKATLVSSFFSAAWPVYTAAALLRLSLLLYGLWQDAVSPVKYTDIDYVVFTDAARFVTRGESPYARETYRYTPLLAWLLLPTTFTSPTSPWITAAWFSSGKVLFAASDLLAGWLLVKILTGDGGNQAPASSSRQRMDPPTARKFAAIWLLNPMVATISTRGSSEGLLAALAAALLWAVLARRMAAAALLLGAAVHFKIYPFIYAPAIVWWMDSARLSRGRRGPTPQRAVFSARAFLTRARVRFALLSLAAFGALNAVMLARYGARDFVGHTFLHHIVRRDHRHNFSPYHAQLYRASAAPPSRWLWWLPGVESLAFVPQLLLSTLLIPAVMAKKDLGAAMLAQTFAFVAFNKVCTSQYFLWYMIFLPVYLPRSSFLRNKKLGVAALALWVATQGLWLQQGFQLEFLGISTFLPALWWSSLAFFLVNCWILGIIIGDVAIREGTCI